MKSLQQLQMKHASYCKSKESTRMMKNQRSDTRKYKLIKDGKKMKIDDIVLKIESINNNL